MHPFAAAELLVTEKDDGVPFRATRNHIHRTWAGTFSSLPELYIQPESVAEVEKAVRLAQKCGRRIVTTGSCHSPSNLTCTSSWMLNLDRLSRVLSLDAETGIVVVEAGIRLHALSDVLAAHGLAMPNLGSIDQQSIAGALATGTHGSSLRHGLVSEAVIGLRLTLAGGGGRTESCSADSKPDLFRAALLSLGALGVVCEVSLQTVPAFDLSWRQTIDAETRLLRSWEAGRLWSQAEFVRVWWFPYTRRAVVWRADKTSEPERASRPAGLLGGRRLGFHLHRSLLWLANWVPSLLPWAEWLVFGLEYGFADGSESGAVQPGRRALLMDCLYSQFVNEWALPLHRGPEALRRLGAWLNRLPDDHPDHAGRGPIPFSAEGLYVHAPVEVRVCDTSSPSTTATTKRPRPYLDPTVEDGPTLFLNATLYRPFGLDPPCRRRYYQAFEWLMLDLGGRPHWAKNFTVGRREMEAMYGRRLDEYRRVRDAVDPDGVFVGPWHRERVLSEGAKLRCEEVEVCREPAPGGGLITSGRV
ncbi:hypothetical protein CP533_4823 [Ophiocordyceps camponoti-saundersi (nom. inval.)]|nr:hypothetical protein CP533_4823 [Ophiocordyceps camponoti-saundersi (nom. inval.)]